jgi:hypothetical protein
MVRNWYRVAYSVPGAKMMKFIAASTEEEAIAKAKEFKPEATMFEAVLLPQGMRTK